MPVDPVCNMQMDEDEAEDTSLYKGKTYFFCSEDCKAEFDQDPERYIQAA